MIGPAATSFFCAWVNFEIETFERAGAEQMQITALSEHNFIDGFGLINLQHGVAYRPCDDLSIRNLELCFVTSAGTKKPTSSSWSFLKEKRWPYLQLAVVFHFIAASSSLDRLNLVKDPIVRRAEKMKESIRKYEDRIHGVLSCPR